MWVLLTNFFNFAMRSALTAYVIQFIVMTAIVLAVAALSFYVINELINVDFFGLRNIISALPDGLLWFLWAFQFHVGLPMVLGAFAARFTIRRLPVIG